MFIQDIVEMFRRVVGRKPDMPHSSLFLFLSEEFKTAEFFTLIIPRDTEIMEEIIVKIIHPAALQLFGENTLIIGACSDIVGRHLVRE